ncbi:Bcr/CflA family efflux MFS transporter [Pseudomonas sp. efr-133-TYG-103a]|uniref:Bcr/CflA family efflux MFS transporter n=1 Tax=Pseudomonas sp. efr-133-TYG-103a TaxID=3040308 RepID=UPI002554AA0A|nr:Bcr/CflA family efflux MFS transporter [Pseudomonas sp. efr-133-TYG-103a]
MLDISEGEKRKKSTVVLLLTMVLLGVFPLDVILPSFPALSAHFDTQSSTIALSISIFAVGFSISQFFLGPLSDRLGRKRLLMLGLTVSIVGAWGCAKSTQFETFIAFRIAQAIGCGCFVLSNALVQDMYEDTERERVRILMTTASGLFISTSPLLGTFLQNAFGWAGSFYLFTLIAILVIIHATFVLPDSMTTQSTTRFWKSFNIIVTNSRFMGFSFISAIAFTCHFSFIAISPVIFLDGFGLSQLQFSCVLLLYGAAYVIGGITAGRLQKLVSQSQQLRIGLGLTGLAGLTLMVLHLTIERSFLTVLLPMIICTTGTTIARPAATSRAMEIFRERAGAAASMLNTTVFVTGGIISAVVSLTVGNFEWVLAAGFVVSSGIGLAIVRRLYRS